MKETLEKLKFDLDKNEYEDGKLTYKIKNIYRNYN